MHNPTSYEWKTVLAKTLLVVAGYILAFRIFFYVKSGLQLHDVMGNRGIWERPYYHFLLTLFPYFYSAPYVRLLSNPHYWLKFVLDLFLPVIAIVAFENLLQSTRARYFVPFYLIVPGTLYLLSSLVVMTYFPFDS